MRTKPAITLDDFIVNILADDQRDLSIRFSQLPPASRFIDAHWDRTTLRNAAAVLECGLAEIHTAGDHAILLAEVFDAKSSGRAPLVYCRSGYHQLSTSYAEEDRFVAALARHR